MMRRAALLLAALAGCSQLPEYRRPAPVETGAWPYAPAPAPGMRPIGEIGWREAFPDPRLQALIAAALEQNRDLREAVLRVDEARAQLRIARADRLPSLDLRASGRLGNGFGRGGGGGGGAPQPGPDPITGVDPITDPGGGTGREGGGGGGGRFRLEAAVTNFELDFWGRVRSLSEAARARWLASEEAARAFRIGLIRDVAEAHLADRDFAARLEIAAAVARTRAENLRLASLRVRAGEAARPEVAEARALLAQAEAAVAALRRQRALNSNALQRLVGRPLDETLPPARPLSGQAILADLPVGLPSDLLTERPDIRAAEQRLIAANADIGAARAAFFPRIALTGFAGVASDDLGGLFDPDGFNWTFIPNLLQPIFNAGRNRAALNLAEVRKDIAIVDYERTIQTAFREVADALAARAFLVEERRARAAERDAQADRARLADRRFAAGEAAALETLDAQRALFAAELALVETDRALLASAVQLFAALGGGDAASR